MGKKVLIAEQSEIIRRGLTAMLESFNLFDTIHELSCDSDIESYITRLEPDLLIVNPGLVKPHLPAWLGEYRNGDMRIAAIVYSLFDDDLARIFDEVIQIGDTRLKIKNKLSGLLSRKDGERPAAAVDNILSAREREVVRLLSKGLSNKEISEQLFISTHTVITHRKNITRKLNIKSVAGLIVYAIINNIISVEEMQQE